MSCMELTKNHYQFVADQLYKVCLEFNRRIEFHTTRKAFPFVDCEDLERSVILYVRKLQSWNVIAHDERYPDTQDPAYKPDHVKKVGTFIELNVYQLLKALECIDYQCIDSEDYDKSEECKLLRTICNDCRYWALHEVPQYNDAKWAID